MLQLAECGRTTRLAIIAGVVDWPHRGSNPDTEADLSITGAGTKAWAPASLEFLLDCHPRVASGEFKLYFDRLCIQAVLQRYPATLRASTAYTQAVIMAPSAVLVSEPPPIKKEFRSGDPSLALENILDEEIRPPKFEDKYEERKFLKHRLVLAFRIFSQNGFMEGPAGHITIRDPVDPTSFWVNPFGMFRGRGILIICLTS